MTTAATIHKIYDLLFSGSELELVFPDKETATAFRKKLQLHKYRIENELKKLEQLEHLSLSMHYEPTSGVARFKIAEPDKELQEYEILNIIPPKRDA